MDINKAELLDVIKKDADFKLEVLQAILEDKKFKIILAKEIFNMPAEYLGISIPGTIGECLTKMVE